MEQSLLEELFHMQIPVPRLDEAIAWYTEHLGFRLSGKRVGAHAFLNLPSGPMLSDATAANFTVNVQTFPVLLYRTCEIHRLHERLTKLGLAITQYNDEGFGWVLKFYDPFGNMWGVIQPK